MPSHFLKTTLAAIFLSCLSLHAASYYVWTDSAANGPGTAWSNAFHDIQSAVNAATNTGGVPLTKR